MRSRGPSDPETARLTEIRLLNLEALRPKIDRLARLAKAIADVPYAYVAIVEADHAWQSGFEGQPEGVVPRELSIASMVIMTGQTLYTPDARIVAANHPWVTGPPYTRFFCGAPIRLASGLIIGAFCIIDTKPRDHDPELVARCEDIAALLADEIERLRAERHKAAAESEVERSGKRLRLAVEIANFMVYEANFRTRTVEVEGAEDVFLDRPLTFEALSGDPWLAIHPEDRPAAMALWKECLRTGARFCTEHRMNRADGREVWAYAAAELIRGPTGRPERLVGVLQDITVRRKAEAALVAARDGAQAANRAKSDFLANMSHEIRTPLNGIIGVATALAGAELPPAQAEMVSLIRSSGAALETILSDVLDFSRIESGHLELRPEKFELESCLRSAAALFEASAQEKGLTFELEVAREVRGAFEGDAGRIRQILFNLLSNAVKFTHAGGVAISAKAVGKTGDVVRVAIGVTDTGIGFDETIKARLFQRFEQADGSITRRFGGSGLGLAISRSLAEAMGGELEAVSQSGCGSTFTLTLPLKPAVVRRAARAALLPEAPPLERAPRVLLAEDHAVNRRVVELILGAAGVELVCVGNGREAVEAVAAGRFDLILMDMQMPEMDGLTAIRAIRAHERTKRLAATPIWALSANALPEHIEASAAAGADGHLTKPISAPALFQALAQACTAERSSTALSA